MGEEYRGKVFRSGNSVALRLPKALGFKEGEELRIVHEDRASFRVETVGPSRPKIDLSGIAGALPAMEPFSPEQRTFDDPASASDGSGRAGRDAAS